MKVSLAYALRLGHKLNHSQGLPARADSLLRQGLETNLLSVFLLSLFVTKTYRTSPPPYFHLNQGYKNNLNCISAILHPHEIFQYDTVGSE